MGNTEIGIRIKTMRMSRGITQAQLAEQLGVAQSTVGMYETGKREPNFETLEALADIFNVTISSIVSGEEIDSEIWELREQLRRNPETRLLFDAAKGATADDLKEAAELIKARKTIRQIKGNEQ